jgi:hypothetical protein
MLSEGFPVELLMAPDLKEVPTNLELLDRQGKDDEGESFKDKVGDYKRGVTLKDYNINLSVNFSP